MSDDRTADKLAIQFAELRGIVTTRLANIEEKVADVKDDTSYLRQNISDHTIRLERLENSGKIIGRIKSTVREWIIAFVAVAALVIGVVRK